MHSSIMKSASITIGVFTLFVSFFASPDATYAWGDEVIDGGCCDYGYSDIYPESGDYGFSDIYPTESVDYGYSDIYPSDYGYSDIYPNDYGYSDIYPNDYGYSDIYPSYGTYYDTYTYDYGSYSYPSYASYGVSSYPVSVGYGVPVGRSGGYSYGGSYGYPTSYSYPVTVASGYRSSHPTTIGTPASIANIDNSVNIVDNSINDSFNTTTIMNSFNSGTGAAQTYHPAPSCTISVTGTFGYGQTLTWHTYNANTATISGVGAVTVGYGTRVVYPTQGQVFSMTVSGQGGTSNCQTSSYHYVAPITPTYPTAPYVALTQIPYTGFDLGPIGNSIYWAVLLSLAAAGAYLIVYYRGGVMNYFVRAEEEVIAQPVFTPVRSIIDETDLDDAAIRRSAQDRVTRDAMSIDLSMGTPRLVIARQ